MRTLYPTETLTSREEEALLFLEFALGEGLPDVPDPRPLPLAFCALGSMETPFPGCWRPSGWEKYPAASVLEVWCGGSVLKMPLDENS